MSFPSVQKVDLENAIQQPEPKITQKVVSSDKIQDKLSKVGLVEDEGMSTDNIGKLMKMTPDQIMQEQAELASLFSSKQLQMLKRLGSKKKEEPTEAEDKQNIDRAPQPKSDLIA